MRFLFGTLFAFGLALLVPACSRAAPGPGVEVDPALLEAMEAEGDELATRWSDPRAHADEEARAREDEQFWAQRDARIQELIRNPPYLAADRLPEGMKIGRCLFVVDGQTRISGECAYRIYDGGEFHIDGPRQVYEGIDFPTANSTASTLSTDWWANVFRDENGVWTGYGNIDVRSLKGDGSYWGELRQEGACFVSAYPWGKSKPGDYDPDYHPYDPSLQQNVRICLWRE